VNSGATLPPPVVEKQSSLFYGSAEQPIGSHNGVAFWLKGDSIPGSIVIYLMASGGQAASPPPIHGTGQDTQPLWPAWISKPITTNFTGWQQVLLQLSDFTYRAPVGADDSAAQPAIASVDAFGIASAKDSGVIYVNAIKWADIDSGGNAIGDSTSIADFSTGDLAGWKVKGPSEAVERLIPGITSQQQFTKDESVSLKLDYSALGPNRALLAQLAARSMQLTRHNYLVSVQKSPFERILPDSLPGINEISSRLVLTECPDQTESGSFALYSLKGLTNVTVHLSSALSNIDRVIPRNDVNISVVKVWDREGSSLYRDPDSFGPTPELIVKDDRTTPAVSDGEAPDVRVIGDPVTDIPAGTEKQFWVDVSVPKDTAPGQYVAQMVVNSIESSPFSLTLQVNVLPLRLLSPAKQYVIDFRGKLSLGDNTLAPIDDLVTPTQMSAEFADFESHGFHYVTLSDGPSTLPQALAAEEQFNFQTPIIYPLSPGQSGFTTAETVNSMTGSASPFCFLVPSGPTMADDLTALKNAGMKTAAVVEDESEYEDVRSNLDVAIYPVDNPYVKDLLRSDGERKYSVCDWLTWSAGQTDPQVDRLYAGFLLWRCDLYGAYISNYQTNYNVNPYDDTVAPADAEHAALRPAMLTYPAKDGVVDTVQWESVREGINDVRYLTTFYSALRECKDAKVDLPEVQKAQTDVTNFLNQAFWLMSDADYQAGRAMIANYALQLRKAIDNYNAHTPGAN
jgi:hypothetical protein